jgi:hypothetical protein
MYKAIQACLSSGAGRDPNTTPEVFPDRASIDAVSLLSPDS